MTEEKEVVKHVLDFFNNSIAERQGFKITETELIIPERLQIKDDLITEKNKLLEIAQYHINYINKNRNLLLTKYAYVYRANDYKYKQTQIEYRCPLCSFHIGKYMYTIDLINHIINFHDKESEEKRIDTLIQVFTELELRNQ